MKCNEVPEYFLRLDKNKIWFSYNTSPSKIFSFLKNDINKTKQNTLLLKPNRNWDIE